MGNIICYQRRLPILPDQLIRGILLQLPVKSLLRFKCVCKSWKTLISESRFANSHLQSSEARQGIWNPLNMGNVVCYQLPLPILPDELILEILLRLPVRSLLGLKCVCKSWKTLISDPRFANNHLRISTADSSMTNQQLLFNVLSEPNKILSYPLNSLLENSSTPDEFVGFSNMMKDNITCGSCNGLLCLYDSFQHCVRLCNPSIRWISKKSPEAFSDDWMIIYYGFGYNKVNDNYKVLVVAENKCSDSPERLTKIYTFGEEDSWRTIKKFPCTSTVPSGEFVSGTLNWMVDNGGVSSNQSVILSFDLEKETYGAVLLPPNDADNVVSMHRLYVLNNCLCVFSETNKTHWVAWLMKQYGVVDSWTKLMIIPHDKFIPSNPSYVDPLFVSKNGVVLLLDAWTNQLVLYNLNSGQLDYHSISTILGLHVHIYHESLISPCF
ncbi:hypothetical protein TSUD_70150 [Trifolium subterraneum]|uniref:F-box domain-containing protein n=1 Tax=Trifolium subterraneum TaxID=3900 RepID=A0A2Z6NEG8_TRISU|nr:hypothetical protein TSUD_70150 [Trifolium subterraneum]